MAEAKLIKETAEYLKENYPYYHNGVNFFKKHPSGVKERDEKQNQDNLASILYNRHQYDENLPRKDNKAFWLKVLRAMKVENPKAYRPLSKQEFVIEMLRKKFSDFEVEKVLPSRRRVDVFFDVGSHVVIVEIDEDSHKGRTDEDKERYKNLRKDFDGRPFYALRFNPDKNEEGDSAVVIKNGKVVANGKFWSSRFKDLIEKLDHCLDEIPKKNLIIYKFGYKEYSK